MLEYQLQLCGTQCSVVEWNPNAKTTVFAMHGWLDNLASFEVLAHHLPNYRIIAIDSPGHGHSEHIPAGLKYHFYDGIYLIDDLAEHFKQDKINLLGHSMGGALSFVYAASCPDKVASLVSIESIGPLTAKPEQMLDLFANSISQRRELTEKQKPIYDNFELALKTRAFASKIKQEYIAPIVERGLEKVSSGYTWRADSRLRVVSPLRLSEPHLLELLSQITIPVLLIEGNEGYLKGHELFEPRKQALKNIEVSSLKGGHHVHLEQPKDCSSLIDNYLARCAY